MRHTTNKRGFTLTEIMLVIAIIVILVGAVSAGIAIDLNRYKNHLASLTTEDGESAWEIAARSEVAGIFGAAASDNAIALASQSAAAESSIAAAALASQSAAAVKASNDAVAASDAAISDAAVSASAAAATTAGSTSAAAATTQAAVPSTTTGGGSPLAGSSVNKSNTWDGGTKHEVSVSLPGSSNSFVVYIPGNPSKIETYGNATVVSLGNDQYRLTYGWSLNSTGFQVYGVSESQINQMYVVSQG